MLRISNFLYITQNITDPNTAIDNVKSDWTYCECQHFNGKTLGAHTL